MDIIESKYKVAPNIALIKYWGKLDLYLNIPLTPSISLTLDHNDICTTTHVKYSESFKHDTFILNNKLTAIPNRMEKII